MNKYVEKVNKLVGMILSAVENEESINLILESNVAYDISKELLYELDANFEYQDGNDFDELLDENEILSVCIICSKDGTVRYMLQPVYDNDGMTYPDEDSEIIYIQDSLYDCIDEDVLDGQIAILIDNEEEFNRVVESLKESGSEECDRDCCNCSCNDEEEIEEDNIFESLAYEMLLSIGEYAENDKDLAYEIICDKLEEAYQIGYEYGSLE